MKRTLFLFMGFASALLLLYNGCKHDPEDYIPDPDTTSCDTSNITYPGTIYPILNQYCISCHSGATPTGGLDFTDYNRVAFVAENGALLNAIKHLGSDSTKWMPQGLPQLDNCKIRQIEIWIRDTTFTPPPDITHPCDPDTIYFEIDVLPILATSCGYPGMGCHDETATEDVRLDSYEHVMNSDVIEPGNPNNSKLFEKITENDIEDRMPPQSQGYDALDPVQIEIIRKWIAQGAQNLYCDEMCDTVNVTFTGTIWPEIIVKHCINCHSGANASNGIHLENHDQVAERAVIPAGQPGSLWGAVTHAYGNFPMPRNQNPLSDCKITQLKKWIDDGTPDN